MTEPKWAGGAIPRLFLYVALIAVLAFSAGPAAASSSSVSDELPATIEGHASWYGPGFAGHRTASGDRFDPSSLTAAHPWLPLGTKIRVTNLHNGRSVLVTVNDRGPYARRRVLDLSEGAARELEMVSRGVARVLIQPL